jgi:hypothetical protein
MVKLSVIKLSVFMPSVIQLSVVNVIIVSVVMLKVVAPFSRSSLTELETRKAKIFLQKFLQKKYL